MNSVKKSTANNDIVENGIEPLNTANLDLQNAIQKFKQNIDTHISTAKILKVVHNCPCPLKCINDIKNPERDYIDPLYIERHNYVKQRIISKIRTKFHRLITIKSEHEIRNGRLDIVTDYDKIFLNYNKKSICIEVKSGKSVDLF